MEQPSLRPLYDSIPPPYEETNTEVIIAEPEIPIDAPLYRCVYKKSKSVARNILKGAWDFLRSITNPILYCIAEGCIISGIIIGIVLFVEYILIPFGNIVYIPVANIIGYVLSVIATIPWFVWVILIMILAIPLYSLFWCLTRNMIPEDWNQNMYKAVSIILGIIIGCLLSWFIGNVINTDSYDAGLILGRILGFLSGFAVGMLLGSPLDSIRYYRNRIKKNSIK